MWVAAHSLLAHISLSSCRSCTSISCCSQGSSFLYNCACSGRACCCACECLPSHFPISHARQIKGWPPGSISCMSPSINAVSQVLHHFGEHRVVHQFVKVGLKIAFGGFLPEFGVYQEERLHPVFLVKLDRSVHLFQMHALFEIQLQVSVVDHVIFLPASVPASRCSAGPNSGHPSGAFGSPTSTPLQ